MTGEEKEKKKMLELKVPNHKIVCIPAQRNNRGFSFILFLSVHATVWKPQLSAFSGQQTARMIQREPHFDSLEKKNKKKERC